jgi:uridine kinase
MEEALRRAMKRDLPLFGSPEVIQARYLQRYFPGQQLYLEAVHPEQRADIVVENNDPANPHLIFPSQVFDFH